MINILNGLNLISHYSAAIESILQRNVIFAYFMRYLNIYICIKYIIFVCTCQWWRQFPKFVTCVYKFMYVYNKYSNHIWSEGYFSLFIFLIFAVIWYLICRSKTTCTISEKKSKLILVRGVAIHFLNLNSKLLGKQQYLFKQ